MGEQVVRALGKLVISALLTAAAVSARGVVVAQASGTTPTEAAWMQCWLDLGGLPSSHVTAARALLGTGNLADIYVFRVPDRAVRTVVGGPAHTPAPSSGWLAAEVPYWRIVPAATAPDARRPFSQTHHVSGCLPYPVRAVALSPQPMVRGQTALLRMETDVDTDCQVTYLSQREPCFREGASGLIVPVGISALEEPGSYPLRVDLVSEKHTAAFTLTLDVAPGNYGFQTINPPPSLAALMDPALRATEDAYLAQWRSLRSPERLWELPLAWPLAQVVPVSADYGDRRSYGGTVDGYHSGVDFRAWTGMPVHAPAEGVVVMAEALEMRGNSVLLDHGAGLVTGYWHLSRIDVGVGETVTRGQPFALVGNTGLSTGAHLHWEVWANGVSVDGKQWLRDDAFGGVFPIGGGAQLVSDEVVAE